MSWDFPLSTSLATSPSVTTPATFSFWAWVKFAQSGSVAKTIILDAGGRIELIATLGSTFDDLQLTRSGMTGSIVCDMSANGVTANNQWVFVGVAMSGFTTLDRFVLATETTPAFAATVTNTLSGTGFTAAAVKYLGNSNASDRRLDGLIHSAGFHTASLSLAEFETARTTFDQSASASWTFLLNDTAAPWSVTAQSGSGDLTATDVTHDADAPSFGGGPVPAVKRRRSLLGVGR
ncbi:hypothetical protein [Microcystis phage Mae-JY09]